MPDQITEFTTGRWQVAKLFMRGLSMAELAAMFGVPVAEVEACVRDWAGAVKKEGKK